MTENENKHVNESLLTKEALKPRWNNLCQRLNIADDHESFNDIVNRYSEPHRHYHTLHHINNCLQEFDSIKTLLDNPESVELAIWYHDIVYVIGQKYNEEKSAEMAVKFCQKNNLSPSFTKQVEDNILATKHVSAGDSQDSQYLADIDMAILGYPPDALYKYEEQIFQEYSTIYSKKEYTIGRIGFLSLLEYPIFQTEFFRNKYEQSVKDNIPKLIKNLQK